MDSLTWYARLAWTDEINQPNQLYEGNLFFSYRFDDFRQVSLTLNQTQQTTFTSLDGNDPLGGGVPDAATQIIPPA